MNTPTTPTDTARLTLDAIAHNVTQLRTALADAYARTGTALTEAGHSVGAAEERRKEAEERAKVVEAKLAEATHQISILYAVDEGRAHGARRIMNERDQAQARAEKAEKALAAMEADRNKWRKYGTKEAQRLAQARCDAATVEQVTDRARKAERRATQLEAGRNMWKSKAEAIERDRDRAAATLQRVRDADTLADALTAVAEHDGLPPEAARAAANIAAAAEQPAAIDAERERDHALRLAAAEQARAEAVRVADRAHQTLLRVKHAPTVAAAWTAIGAHFHMPATDAGRGARRWRSTAEEEHGLTCEQFNEAAAARDRFEAAWQNARQRARFAAHRGEMVRARAERHRQSRNQWTRKALDAEDTIKRVRALLGTHLGPLATNAVRDALATPES